MIASSSSIDQQIARYVTHNFNAETEAQYVFKSYVESDISKQLNEMTTIQSSIETVLRQKVRSNYGMFLSANDEIHQVDEEMVDLKGLIINTQKLVDDVYNSRLSELKSNSNSNKNNGYTDDEDDENTVRNTDLDQSKEIIEARNSLPTWLTKAPEDLAQYIVEQQYAKAVVIILKCRSYVEAINKDLGTTNTPYTRNFSMSNPNSYAYQSASNIAAALRTQVLIELLERIDLLCSHLALTIDRSIMNLPNSSLWGKIEQNKLLKLLITLEEFDMAAEGFANSKITSVQNALNRVDMTEDTLLLTTDLSSSFFNFMLEACHSFQVLFESHFHKPETLNLLLTWVQNQLIAFMEVLSQHMDVGVMNLANSIISQFRKTSLIGIDIAKTKRGGKYTEGGGNINKDKSSEYTLESVMEAYCGCGPLSLLSHCISAAYTGAKELDSNPHIQSSVCLGWLCVPIVQGYVQKYTDQIIEQISSELQQDAWTSMSIKELRVRVKSDRATVIEINSTLPIFFEDDDDDDEDEEDEEEEEEDDDEHKSRISASKHKANKSQHDSTSTIHRGTKSHTHTHHHTNNSTATFSTSRAHENISRSYAWLVSILTHFCDEVIILLKATDNVPIKTLASMAIEAEKATTTNTKQSSMLPHNHKSTTAQQSSSLVPPNNNHIQQSTTSLPAKSESNIAKGAETKQYGYSRSDMCEIDSVAIASILRIFLRYVIELETLNTRGFTKLQLVCFVRTLQAIVDSLIPSLQYIITTHFFAHEVPYSQASPIAIFRSITPRLQKIITEKQLEIDPDYNTKSKTLARNNNNNNGGEDESSSSNSDSSDN